MWLRKYSNMNIEERLESRTLGLLLIKYQCSENN
jgi:hypothetical protein